MKNIDNSNEGRRALAKELIEIWEFEMGQDFSEHFKCTDYEALVITLENIRELLNKEIMGQ